MVETLPTLSSPTSLPLAGKVALVTGSTTGLGLAIAIELGRRGAKVALNYAHNRARATKAMAEYQAATDSPGVLIAADVCSSAGVDSLVSQTVVALGPIDILVPNATGPQPQLPIESYTWAHYQEMVDFFIKSPFLLTQAVLAHMKQQAWGRIVNIGSEVYEASVGNFSAYVAAKGGQKGWTRSMATELAPYGITVNLVAPGWIPTERHADSSAPQLEGYAQTIPAGRWGTPEDIADSVAYLCAPAASFVTGQTLIVNGGRSPN